MPVSVSLVYASQEWKRTFQCDNEFNSRSLSWSSSVYPATHRRIWQTTVSSSLASTCADSARPTRRCVLFDGHTTSSAIGVSQRLDHPRLSNSLPWWRRGVAVQRRTRDREVVGSSLSRALRRKNSGQVSHTYG